MKVEVPPGWAPNLLTFYFEGEDLSGEDRPFAANVILQLRTDVGTEDDPRDVARLDLATLERSLPSVEVRASGELEINGVTHHHHELVLDDGDRPLRQLCVYAHRGGQMYTFTATHLEERFEGTRPQVLQMASTLLATSASAKA